MNFSLNKNYFVDSIKLQNVFQKFGISCSLPINESEFVKEICEITQTVSVHTSDPTYDTNFVNKKS